MTSERQLSTPGDVPPDVALLQLVTGHYVSRAIYAAAKLELADLIGGEPRHYTALAEATGTRAELLHRLLRLLASAGVVADHGDGCFGLTPVGHWLRKDVPGSRRAQALLLTGPAQQRAWSGLLQILTTGETPSGRGAFEYLARYPEESATFNDAMFGASARTGAAVAAAYDFSRMRTVVDVGGGHGVLLAAILTANLRTRGILFDLPHASAGAGAALDAAGLSARCDVVSGDFFESVPDGGDAYLLKSVIHDWDDARALATLGNCRRAMADEATLLLVELVAPERVEHAPLDRIIAGSDVNMLVNVGGQERSAADFRGLLEAAGFELTRIIPLGVEPSLLEAAPRPRARC